jgi:hypothetical protein
MKIVPKIIILIVSLSFVCHSKIDTYISITGGTNGLGVKYSWYFNRISLNVGLPFMYKYYKSNLNDGLDYTENKFTIEPYFMVTGSIIKKKNFLFNIGLSEINKLGYTTFKYQDDSRNKNGNNPSFIATNNVGPVIEFVGIKEDEKRFSVQLVPFCFYLTSGESYWHTILQLNYFIKKIRHRKLNASAEQLN